MFENTWLVTRNVAMIVLFPGTVTAYFPYRLLTPAGISGPNTWSLTHYVSVLMLVIGIAVLMKSIWSFARVGKGTLAPFDETQKLIVVGLYRYVRNPMYVGSLGNRFIMPANKSLHWPQEPYLSQLLRPLPHLHLQQPRQILGCKLA